MAEQNQSQQQNAPELPPLLGRGGSGSGRGHMLEKAQKAKDRRGTLRRLWGYLSQQRAALIATTLMVIVSTLLNLLGPYLMGVAIDQYIITHDLAGLAGPMMYWSMATPIK